MSRRLICLLASLSAGGCDNGAPALDTGDNATVTQTVPVASNAEPLPDIVRVRLDTEAGPILLALDAKNAPITTANFVRYVDERRFDGITFYRAAPTKGAPGRGFIQGGIRRNYRLMLPPIAHEPTSQTGLKHEAGTISMARAEDGAGAMGEFFILTGDMPSMNAAAGKPGYASFGRVEEGMAVVRKILSAPTSLNAGRGAMRGQMLARPVRILTAKRVR